MGELRSLEVGDIIMTEKPAKSPVTLTAEGVPKFLARVGQFKGKRASEDRPSRSEIKRPSFVRNLDWVSFAGLQAWVGRSCLS
jgi:hypothetical protein